MPAADLDEAIASVAKLAAVPKNNRAKFARFIKSAIREADNRGPGQQPRVRNVKPRLIKLRAALTRARSVLNSMVPASDRNRQPDYRGEVAGTYLSAVSSRSISDWIEDVDKAIRAASRIPKTKHSVGR